MEVFVDGGLFEVVALAGATALGRWLYSRKFLAYGLLVLSVLGPVALVFLVESGVVRWVAAISSAMALINATVVFQTIRRGDGTDASRQRV